MVFVNRDVIIQGRLGLTQKCSRTGVNELWRGLSGYRTGAAKPLGKPGTLCITHHGPSTSPNRGGSAAASWLWLRARRTNVLVPRGGDGSLWVRSTLQVVELLLVGLAVTGHVGQIRVGLWLRQSRVRGQTTG